MILRPSLWAGLAAATVLAGATPGAAQTPPGVLVVGQIAEPQSLDPQAVTAANDFRIAMNVYEGLVRYASGTLDLEPALATDWQVSDDGLTYTFDLREGVTFHDGSPFNAEAVKFNFDRMLDDDHPFHDTGPFPLSFQFDVVDEVAVLDENTVEFTLEEPFAPFLSTLAQPIGLMVSPARVEAEGENFGRNPSGTGPFQFAEWVPNQRVVVTPFADYWGDVPQLEAVVFRPVTDPNTRVAEMLSGGIDVLLETPPDNVATFRDGPGFTVHEAVGPHVWFAILNTREGPFSDLRVRQAANYAVNKQSLVDDVLQGTAEVAAGPVPAAFDWAANPDVQPYPYDPERARALLAEAGVESPQVTFLATEGGSGMLDPIPMATAIQADLAAVGFEVDIQTFEWNTYLAEVNPGLGDTVDMAEMAWMTNDPDTLPYLTLHSNALPEEGGFNSGYFADPELDALLDEARGTTDLTRRAELYRQIQALVHEAAPWLFVASWRQNAVTSDRVSGFVLQPDFTLVLRDVTKN